MNYPKDYRAITWICPSCGSENWISKEVCPVCGTFEGNTND